MRAVQFELALDGNDPTVGESLNASSASARIPVEVRLVRNLRARRYILRLQPDGTARLTIPRGGSIATARSFLNRKSAWLDQQVSRLRNHDALHARVWTLGATVLFRGEQVRIEPCREPQWIQLGSGRLKVKDISADLRPEIEVHLTKLATAELPGRVQEYAIAHGLAVRNVVIRNQRTRWGSCSPRGAISLNWRLIQTPPFVRDYICLHELMHLREMNHSRRFWHEVEKACPYFEVAEQWLKAYCRLLH